MLDSIWFYIILCLFSTFVSSLSQVMLKKAAMKNHGSVIKEYLNPMVVFAYCIFLATTIIGVWVYKVLPLSLGPVLETTGYIYITLFGVLIFKEKMTKKKLVALGLIIVGIIVFAFA